MKWTPEEIELLKSKYNTLSNEELQIIFPNRTYLSIYKKARALGIEKEKSIEFLNRSNARKGNKSASWKGGKKKTRKGYILILMPEHPRADRNGYVFEHIVVFERETGLRIPEKCCVHHINGDKSDNRISNLCMMTNAGHTAMHNSKNIDIKAMIDKINKGEKISAVCNEFGITAKTFYKKREEYLLCL